MAKRPVTSKPLHPITTKRRRRPLGPFSYLLMSTLSRLPKEHCYGAVLEQQLSEKYNEVIDLAQVYVALQRLAKAQFVKGKDQIAPTGHNHPVVVYTITPQGWEALEHATQFYKMLAADAPD